MDYEVFLVARVREARRSGLDEHAAISEGLERTGGIITSAAAIMIVVPTHRTHLRKTVSDAETKVAA